MRGRAASCLRNAVLAGALAGLGACQTAGQGPVVTASLAQAQPANAMEGDIVRILKQGGLSSSAPGSLQTKKMPADVQQAVAALQGGEAVPVPFGGGAAAAAGVTPVGVQSMPPQAGASSIALLPTASGPIPTNALALAPVQPPAAPIASQQQPALLAALAQTQAAHARRAAAPRLARVPAAPAVPAFPVARPATVLALAPVPVAPAAPAAPPEPPPPRRF